MHSDIFLTSIPKLTEEFKKKTWFGKNLVSPKGQKLTLLVKFEQKGIFLTIISQKLEKLPASGRYLQRTSSITNLHVSHFALANPW